MSVMTEGRPAMAKKKASPGKRPGTMVRVSDAFAEIINKAAALEEMSIAHYADAYLTPAVRKLYSEALVRESRKMEGK